MGNGVTQLNYKLVLHKQMTRHVSQALWTGVIKISLRYVWRDGQLKFYHHFKKVELEVFRNLESVLRLIYNGQETVFRWSLNIHSNLVIAVGIFTFCCVPECSNILRVQQELASNIPEEMSEEQVWKGPTILLFGAVTRLEASLGCIMM